MTPAPFAAHRRREPALSEIEGDLTMSESAAAHTGLRDAKIVNESNRLFTTVTEVIWDSKKSVAVVCVHSGRPIRLNECSTRAELFELFRSWG